MHKQPMSAQKQELIQNSTTKCICLLKNRLDFMQLPNWARIEKGGLVEYRQ